MNTEPEQFYNSDIESRCAVFESLNYPVCVIGVDGMVSYGNNAFKNLYGSGSGELRLHIEHPFYPEYRKRLAQAYLAARNGTEKQCFAVIESTDGKQIPVEIYLFPMFEGEKVEAILALLRIVDDRLLSFDRSTLSQISEDNFQYDNLLFEFSPMPIMRLNENMEIIRCSHSLEGFLGYTQDELIERKKVQLQSIFPYDADRIKKSAIEILSGTLPFQRKGEIKITTSDQDSRVANLIMYPIVQENEITSIEIIFEDITEIKTLKDKINSINRIQLLQDITKGFLHSLNNSINIIMSQTQLLLQITEKQTVLDGIHIIEKSALDIVDNIRRVQNSIAEKSNLSEERIEPLVNIIEDAIEFSRMQFKVEDKEKKRNIAIEKKYFTAANIKIDTGMLREIIISIILKVSAYIRKRGTLQIALKENGDITLEVSVEKGEQEIDTVQLPKLVNVFSGIDIRQAAEKINLKLMEEESSTSYAIKLYFPARLIVDRQRKESAAPDFKIRDLDIIIVEDEKALQKILFELFDRMGNRVSIFENGNDALEEFKQHHYDLVITDYGILGITGIELAARIKEIDENITTILLSGWTIDDIQAYRNVVDLFLPKPFKLDDLLKNIGLLLKDKM
jgi:PAS domain S-box-containing protein